VVMRGHGFIVSHCKDLVFIVFGCARGRACIRRPPPETPEIPRR
jgi:hypothetical protein